MNLQENWLPEMRERERERERELGHLEEKLGRLSTRVLIAYQSSYLLISLVTTS